MVNNILVIGSHPDDVEIGCGGTIVKHTQSKDRVFILILTNGEGGNHAIDKNECINSLKHLGINESDIFFGNFPDGYLRDSNQVVSHIEEYLIKFNIKRVYTHYPIDRHQDHRNCSKAVSSASRKIPELLFYQGPSTMDPFEPHYFIELSEDQLLRKIEALENYKTQIDKGVVNLEWLRSLSIVNGLRANTKYAEAFALNHLIQRGENV